MSIDRPSEAPLPSLCPPAAARTGQQLLLVSDPARFFLSAHFPPRRRLAALLVPGSRLKSEVSRAHPDGPAAAAAAPLCSNSVQLAHLKPEPVPAFQSVARGSCRADTSQASQTVQTVCGWTAARSLDRRAAFPNLTVMRPSDARQIAVCPPASHSAVDFADRQKEARLSAAGSTLQIRSQQHAFSQVDRAHIRRPNRPSMLFILRERFCLDHGSAQGSSCYMLCRRRVSVPRC